MASVQAEITQQTNHKNSDMVSNYNSNTNNNINCPGSTNCRRVFEIEPIFRQLQEFIDYKSINSLLNSTKSFESIKKRSYYWKLNKLYSTKFYRFSAGGRNTFDTRFKLKLDSLLTNVNIQLSLNLSSSEGPIDVSAVANMNALNLRGCRVTDFTSCNVQTLDIRKCGFGFAPFPDVLGGVQNLLWLDSHDGDVYLSDNDEDDDDESENSDDDDFDDDNVGY
jgi:hypothetical protein